MKYINSEEGCEIYLRKIFFISLNSINSPQVNYKTPYTILYRFKKIVIL